jgi:hypothetical protein
MTRIPRILLPPIIDTEQKQQTSGAEKDEPYKIELFDKLPPCLAVGAVLGVEGGWEVRQREHDAEEAVPGAHVPVGPAPAEGGGVDEGVGDEGAEEGGDAEEFEAAYNANLSVFCFRKKLEGVKRDDSPTA